MLVIMADDIIVINDPAVLSGQSSRLRSRTSKSGKVGYYVEIQSEPLIHAFDPKTLGKPVAEAMAEVLRQKVRGITAVASASTIATRARKAAAFAKNLPGAMKRYGGGRIGPMAPNMSDRKFNDSGRFASSIVAGAADDAWRVNVASNRLDPQTAGGEIAVRRIWNELTRLVPEFARPLMLFNDEQVKLGLKTSLESMIVKAEMRREQLTQAAAAARVSAVRQVLGVLVQLAA